MADLTQIVVGQPRTRVQARLPDGRIYEAPPGTPLRDLMGAMFTDDDLKQRQRIKCAFDPEQRLNPGKVFPVLHRCAELGRMHVHGGQLAFPELERF